MLFSQLLMLSQRHVAQVSSKKGHPRNRITTFIQLVCTPVASSSCFARCRRNLSQVLSPRLLGSVRSSEIWMNQQICSSSCLGWRLVTSYGQQKEIPRRPRQTDHAGQDNRQPTKEKRKTHLKPILGRHHKQQLTSPHVERPRQMFKSSDHRGGNGTPGKDATAKFRTVSP